MARHEELSIGKAVVESLYLGTDGGTQVTSTAAELNVLDGITATYLVGGLAAGYKLARGFAVCTASTIITTGLTTITGYAVTPTACDTATKANYAALVSAKVASGTITAYRWKHTGASTPTLVAASTAGNLAWIAVGT